MKTFYLMSQEQDKIEILKDWRKYDFGSIKEITVNSPRRYYSAKGSTYLINSIENNCFIDFKKLEKLKIDFTCIKNIEINSFQHLTNLKILVLRENQIKQIDSNGFQGLDNLEELNLTWNHLTKIGSNLFQYLNKLKRLYLP